jgi:uncharacterized protein YdeI (YjbR/CyaY-like superfamily)
MESEKDGIPVFYAPDGQTWRNWLATHHDQYQNVWLVIYKKKSATPSVYYQEALDEALCFGWIDSKINKRDDQSFYQFFARRNPKSNWSAVNKAKVAKLIAEGRMQAAGRKSIEIAQQNGTWTALDEVEQLIQPPDLQAAFAENPTAKKYFEAFPASVQRGLLEWLLNAKQAATRQKRIVALVAAASNNERLLFAKK